MARAKPEAAAAEQPAPTAERPVDAGAAALPEAEVSLQVVSAIAHDGQAYAPSDALTLPAGLAQPLILSGAAVPAAAAAPADPAD